MHDDGEPTVHGDADTATPLPFLSAARFGELVDDVAAHVSVALDLSGHPDWEPVVREPVSDGVYDDLVYDEGHERVVMFEDASGNDLPVYVSCGIDGTLVVMCNEESGCVAVAPVRSAATMGELVTDVVRALADAVPVDTFH